MHLRSNDSPQPLIPRHAKHELYAVLLAPTHQLVTTETGIAAQDDFHFRPCPPDLRHDPADLCQAAKRSIVIGFPQPRAQ
jgi:hypothetical protein